MVQAKSEFFLSLLHLALEYCPHIRDVVHIGVPSTMEEYFQESERAGKNGDPAISRIL